MNKTNSMLIRNSNKEFSFLDKLDLDQEVKRRLSISLTNTKYGSDEVYVTPITKEHGAEYLLAEWDKVFQANKGKLNSVLLEIEETQKSKCGPLSIAKPWKERRDGLLAYFEKTNVDYSDLLAVPEATRDKGILRPLSLQNASNFLKNSTNSGLPFYTKKGIVKDRLLARFEYYLKRKDPCILFTRTTEQRKTRDVWGYPFADTLNEMRYYRPLLDYQRKLEWRSALNGPDNLNKKMTSMILKAKSSNLELISVDFSNYDRSIKQGLQFKVADYYKYLFQEKYRQEIDDIISRKSEIGIVTPDGVVYGEHGEPSGSTLTNEDDSIAQYIIAVKSGCVIRNLMQIQGDDGGYCINGDKVNSFYNNFKKYGLDINTLKSFQDKDFLVYLQCLYHIDYIKDGVIGGIYPVYRALNRIMYQERWSNFEDYGIIGKDYYALRTISILENCKFHPLFKELVTFVFKYDKYKLTATKQGVIDYIKMIKDSSGVEGILINQYGDDVKNILKFETVKIIDSLVGA